MNIKKSVILEFDELAALVHSRYIRDIVFLNVVGSLLTDRHVCGETVHGREH